MDTNMEEQNEGREFDVSHVKHWSMVVQTLMPYSKYIQSDLKQKVTETLKALGNEYIVVDHPAETKTSDVSEKSKPWDGVHHLHIGIKTDFQYHLTKNYAYSKLAKHCKINYSQQRQPNTQTMRHPMGWLRYVTQPPRRIMEQTKYWENLRQRAQNEKQTTTTTPATQKNKSPKQDKESKNATNLQFLIHLIQQHNIKQTGEILTIYNQNKLSKQQSHKLFSIIAGANYHTLVTKAMALECQRTQTLTFDELMTEYSENSDRDSEKYETVDTSVQVMKKIAQHNGWDQDEFLENLRSVLNKSNAKKNTFVLIGQPNSGKSLIVRSLIPITRFYAEIKMGTSYNFVWQDGVDKNLIVIEEPCISDDALVEECKLIFEGHDTMVHKKNQGDVLLKRTPVVITTNQSITKYFPAAKAAMDARTYTYKTKTAPFLKHVSKQLNPNMWNVLFQELENKKKQQLTLMLDDSFDEQLANMPYDDSTIVITDDDQTPPMTLFTIK